MPVYAEKNMRHVRTLLKYVKKCGNRRNMRQFALFLFVCTFFCQHRRRLHRGNRELRPGTHARTGENVAFCPGTFHGCALIFKV